MTRHIVYTAHSGAVYICTPTKEALRAMSAGGIWRHERRGFLEAQIELQISSGIHPDHARKFAHAVAFGGLSTSEAFDVIRLRDCDRHGTLHEVHDSADIPVDRWFRDAWTRSPNGGPIGVKLSAARVIHWDKIRKAVDDENKRRRKAFEPLRPIAPPWNTIRSAIKHARDEDELRRVWLPELSKH